MDLLEAMNPKKYRYCRLGIEYLVHVTHWRACPTLVEDYGVDFGAGGLDSRLRGNDIGQFQFLSLAISGIKKAL